MRGIPQTRWPCRECDGTGCECCGFTGKIYEKSVEELICRSVLDEFGGEDLILHGCGREDVDALMLGPGRPFVFEVKEPVKRRISISSLQRRINKENEKEIAVFCLRYVKKEMVARIKNLKFDKVYRAKLEIEGNISKSELEMALEGLTGAIHQRTPFRVSQRRKDIVRDRRVRCAKIVSFDERLIEVCCESGLYIKELISGDEGRTIPNLSDLLKKDTRVSELDVINMKYPLTH
jgi:tRNA pseudouridine synthase 10